MRTGKERFARSFEFVESIVITVVTDLILEKLPEPFDEVDARKRARKGHHLAD